jgi:Ca2+-binding EF-hand superfamily protein
MSTKTKVSQAFAKVIESLRLQMFAKAMPGLGPLNAAFQQVDWAGSGVVSRLDFNDVLNYIGMFLTEQNITTVQKFFASNPNDVKITATIPIAGFMDQLCVALNERRNGMVNKAWSTLTGTDEIATDSMCSSYNASNHIYVRQGTQSPEELLNAFRSGFFESFVTKNDFVTYYTDLSASIPRDSFFVQLLEDTWSIKEEETAVDKQRMNFLATLLKEKVRQKAKDGKAGAVLLKSSFDFFDVDDANKLTKSEFYEANAHFGLQLTDKDVNDYYYLYGTPEGTISITLFSKEMYNGTFDEKVTNA